MNGLSPGKYLINTPSKSHCERGAEVLPPACRPVSRCPCAQSFSFFSNYYWSFEGEVSDVLAWTGACCSIDLAHSIGELYQPLWICLVQMSGLLTWRMSLKEVLQPGCPALNEMVLEECSLQAWSRGSRCPVGKSYRGRIIPSLIFECLTGRTSWPVVNSSMV